MLSQYKPFIVTVMSTKGGVTKSTNVANIGAYCADHGIRTLMIDTDTQPTVSSYYHIVEQSPYGIYEFFNRPDLHYRELISKTEFPNLDIIQSNDPNDRLTTELRNHPAGALLFNKLIHQVQDYDLIIIDTRGTRGITVDMTVIASDLVISPIKPELVSAREFVRGTLSLYQSLEIFTDYGLTLPPLKAVINCLDHTKDAKEVVETLHEVFENTPATHIELLNFAIPDRVAYREAASRSQPVHRHSAKEAENIRELCLLLFPQWADKFSANA